jgi:hypothetical protein
VNDFYGMYRRDRHQRRVSGNPVEAVQGLYNDDKAKLGWASIYMKVKGYEAEKPEPADSPVDSVDDLVRQLEAQGKV